MDLPTSIKQLTPRVWQEVITIADSQVVAVGPDQRFQAGLTEHMFEFVSRLADSGEEFRFGYCKLATHLGRTACADNE